jgi:hypothetical protein
MSRATRAAAAGGEAEWLEIRESPLAAAYVAELRTLAVGIIETANAIFEATPPAEVGRSYIKVDPPLMRRLLGLIGEAARVAALLTPHRSPRGIQATELVRRRAEWLRGDVLGGLELEAILDAAVRHSLEHFDEYLDDAAQGALSRGAPSLLPMDMIVGRRGTFSELNTAGTTLMFRVYIADEALFVNCGREIRVDKLATEARAIVDRLVERFGSPPGDGSLMFVLPERDRRPPGGYAAALAGDIESPSP